MPRLSGSLNFLKNRVLGNIIGFGAGAAAAQAFEPALRPLAHKFESQFQNLTLSPAELAELVIRSERSIEDAGEEAQTWGLNARRFEELTKLAGNPPGPQELIELWRRGVIGEAEVDQGMRQGRFRSEWIPAVKAFRRVLLTPAGIAEMGARGIISEGEAASYLEELGLDAEDADASIEAAQHPPPLGELLDLLNRGTINEGDVTHALERAGIEQRYREPLLELRRVLPSVQDLIRFAVREVYTPEIASRFGLAQDFPPAFAEEAARRGLAEEDARSYWMAHWDLPSPEMGFRMYQRGIIDRPTLELLLRSLDVMPYWRSRVIELAYLVPGRIDLRRMFNAGVIDEARVYKGYLDIGYSPENARLLTEFAKADQLDEDRPLVKSEILGLYQAQAISRDEAGELLGNLGYAEPARELLLALADARRRRSYRTAAVGVVKRRFLDREIDSTEASNRLDLIGLPAEERDELLDLWAFELEENPRRLTEAQARKAWATGLRDQAWYEQYLALLGYAEEERAILVSINEPAG